MPSTNTKLSESGSLFWRRLMAWLVDLFIVEAIIVLLLSVFVILMPDKIRLSEQPISIGATTFSLPIPIEQRYDEYLPELPGYIRTQQEFQRYAFFIIPNGKFISLTNSNGTTQINIKFPINGAGDPAYPLFIDPIFFIMAWLFLMPLLIVRNKNSFGKELLGIKIIRKNGAELQYIHLLKRELLRSWIFVVSLFIAIKNVVLSHDYHEIHKPLYEIYASGSFSSLITPSQYFLWISIALFILYIIIVALLGKREWYWDKWSGHKVILDDE